MPCTAPIANISVRHKVIDNCWNYLHDNFHKFNEANKIKVILTICGKNVPQEIISDAKDTNIIIVRDKKEQVELQSRIPQGVESSKVS